MALAATMHAADATQRGCQGCASPIPKLYQNGRLRSLFARSGRSQNGAVFAPFSRPIPAFLACAILARLRPPDSLPAPNAGGGGTPRRRLNVAQALAHSQQTADRHRPAAGDRRSARLERLPRSLCLPRLVRSLDSRAAELPLASTLSQHVATLRITLGEVRGGHEVAKFNPNPPPFDKAAIGQDFDAALAAIHQTLDDYRQKLGGNDSGSHSLDDSKQEQLTVSQIDECLAAIDTAAGGEGWIDDDSQAQTLDVQLQRLQMLAAELPDHLFQRMERVKDEVHSQYRAWIVLAYTMSISTVLLLVVFIRLFYTWVFRPLRMLVKGSRRWRPANSAIESCCTRTTRCRNWPTP